MDEKLLAEARRAQERLIDAERDEEVARAEFYRAIRRLHLNGASLRELAAGLSLSHQRVHQIVESAGGSRRWLRRRVTERPDVPMICTFCGKRQAEVSKLIAGPGACICAGCVGLAQAAIGSGEAAGTAAGPGTGQLNAVPAREHRTQCSFCGKYRHQVSGLAVSSAETGRKAPATVCTECLELCEEIIAEDMPPTT